MKIMAWIGLVLGALSAAGEVIVKNPGQTVTLNCNANTYNTLEWFHKDDRIFFVDGRNGRERKGQSAIVGRSVVRETSLVVSSVKEEDAGRFRCTVNRKSQEHLLLLHSVSSTPSGELQLGSEATLHCQVKGLDPGPTVQWRSPDGSQTESETVRLNPVTNSHSGTWECSFTHESVTHKESLVVRVKAPETAPTLPPEKTKEVSKPGCTNCATPPPKSPVLLELSWWVWVAVGVGGLVVIVLIVIIIVMCKKIRRRKRKYQRNQNGHHPMKPRQYCQCNRPTAAAKPQQGRRREKPVALPRQPLLME